MLVQGLRCRALTTAYNVSAVRGWHSSAAVEKPPQGRHFHLAGVIMLINVGGAAIEELTTAATAGQTPGKTVAIAERSVLPTDFPLWAERNRKIVIPLPQAPAERQTSGHL